MEERFHVVFGHSYVNAISFHVNGGTQSGLDLYGGCGKILCGKDIFDDVETHDTAVHANGEWLYLPDHLEGESKLNIIIVFC